MGHVLLRTNIGSVPPTICFIKFAPQLCSSFSLVHYSLAFNCDSKTRLSLSA
jgi:hypothetical protein